MTNISAALSRIQSIQNNYDHVNAVAQGASRKSSTRRLRPQLKRPYRPGHIAISLGNGKTMEARGKDYGVGVFSAQNRGWTAGGLIPELSN